MSMTQAVPHRLHRTQCSVCHLGVYEGQPTVWTRGIHLGTSHEECAADLCAVCGKRFEGLGRSGSQTCSLCALILERFGPIKEIERERFGYPKKVKA